MMPCFDGMMGSQRLSAVFYLPQNVSLREFFCQNTTKAAQIPFLPVRGSI
jgi:hypothetical protein